MFHFNQIEIESLAATASRAAAYLDACDQGAPDVPLDPAYYQACGNLLRQIFTVVGPQQAFPLLLEHSPAACEMAESIVVGKRIEISRLGYYPELTVLMNRAAA